MIKNGSKSNKKEDSLEVKENAFLIESNEKVQNSQKNEKIKKEQKLKKETLIKEEEPTETVETEENKVEEKKVEVEDDPSEQQKKKLDEIEQAVSKQNSKKSKIINWAFFFLNIAVVGGILFYQLSKEEFVPLTGLKVNFGALSIAILLLIGVLLTEVLSFGYLLKQSVGRWHFAMSYKVSQIGRYYDAVTPMATGGQPFQITYLKSRGVPIHNALSIPLTKYLFSQIAWVLVSLVCLIISFVDTSYGTFVSVMSIIGFILGFVVLAATIFLSVCKTVGKKLVVKVLKLLCKMKIVKNYDKQYEKITKYISDFQDVMKQYAKSPKDFIVMLFLSLSKLVLNYSIPFFIVCFFQPGVSGDSFFRMFVMTILVDLSASFFPLPGGSGVNEISFALAFGAVIHQESILVWVLILWRFFSYYFYLLQGVSIISYDMAYGNKKYKWIVKKEQLMEESSVFKQNQIDKFRIDRAKRRKNKQKNHSNKEYL